MRLYVGPQVWSTRPGRAKTLAAAVDHLLSIHAFDAPYFEAQGLPVTFVGNSALTVDFSRAKPARLRKAIGAGPQDAILLVLPGSRPGEVGRMLPIFEDALTQLKAAYPDLHIVVPAAPTVAEMVRSRVAGWPFSAHVIEGEAGKLDAMRAATVALVCSGTVTIEVALAGTPMVIGYQLPPVSGYIVKKIIRTPFITLFNIAADDFAAPEWVQDACVSDYLAQDVARRLDDAELRARQTLAQYAALDRLGRGGPDPNEAAADAVLKIVAARRA